MTKTYKVVIREESGDLTATFFVAESAEQLFAYLAEVGPNLDVVSYKVVS